MRENFRCRFSMCIRSYVQQGMRLTHMDVRALMTTDSLPLEVAHDWLFRTQSKAFFCPQAIIIFKDEELADVIHSEVTNASFEEGCCLIFELPNAELCSCEFDRLTLPVQTRTTLARSTLASMTTLVPLASRNSSRCPCCLADVFGPDGQTNNKKKTQPPLKQERGRVRRCRARSLPKNSLTTRRVG